MSEQANTVGAKDIKSFGKFERKDMTLAEQVLDKLAKENGQDNWDCLKQSLVLTKDHFTITYVKCAVELALSAKQAEVLKEIERLQKENKDGVCWHPINCPYKNAKGTDHIDCVLDVLKKCLLTKSEDGKK